MNASTGMCGRTHSLEWLIVFSKDLSAGVNARRVQLTYVLVRQVKVVSAYDNNGCFVIQHELSWLISEHSQLTVTCVQASQQQIIVLCCANLMSRDRLQPQLL